MDRLPDNLILEIPPSTLNDVRSFYNLNESSKMDESINILEEWMKKQDHFKKKDFYRDQLERIIISAKGSVERAKTRLDNYCTLRSILPHFFGIFNLRDDFKQYHEDMSMVILPKFAQNYYRVFMMTCNKSILSSASIEQYFKIGMVFSEYWRWNDYLNGMIAIMDLSKVNIVQTLPNINLINLQMVLKMYIDGYGIGLKGIHIITTSTFVELFINILKQAVSEKIGKRIQVHKNIEEVYAFVPKEILPKDYGGDERSMAELTEAWINELSMERHTKTLQEMMKAGVNESYRHTYKCEKESMGLPGTFRTLNVD